MQKPIIGISIGDPNGIGPEVVAKTLQNEFIYQYCTPVVYGNIKVFNHIKKLCFLEHLHIHQIKNIQEIKYGKLNFIHCGNDSFQSTLGTASKEAGKESISYIDRMLEDVQQKNIQIVVTAPVDKNSIALNQANFTGHTGYLAKSLNVKNHLMVLYNEGLRVGLVTEHLPITKLAESITSEAIISKAKVFIQTLQNDFSIVKPKLAILGLNPHAGDGGALGNEEINIIKPAIESVLNQTNAVVLGPYSADGFFGSGNMKKFDGILAMYHDQGLAPFKALAFDDGVNFTAGLPIIRTSPDHGTAYDIASNLVASPYSFSNALFEALKLYTNRTENKEMKDNFLPFMEHKKERFRLETRDLPQ